MPKPMHMQQRQQSLTPPDCGENSLGLSPAVLAKRRTYQPELWCPKADPLAKYFDPWCDPHRPKTVHHSEVAKAHRVLKKILPRTRIMKSNECAAFDMNLYFKLETFGGTGSFHDRGAIYALHMLSNEQRKDGVVTATLGNWGLALATQAKKLAIPATVFFPSDLNVDQKYKCKQLGVTVENFGKTMIESSRGAISSVKDTGVGTYINGYDHPHVIAAEGTIGIEILEQLPETDVIIVPVGGGGLIAGIAAAAKKLKPEILIYGVEINTGGCFFKALSKGSPYIIDVSAYPNNMTIAGYNAFHTAQSLVDKMILVEEDWVARALLHLVEYERLVAEHMGALGFAALFSNPYIVPELRDKTVVCVISGANFNMVTWPRSLHRAKIIEGRLMSIEITYPFSNLFENPKIFQVLANLRVSVIDYTFDEDAVNDLHHYKVIIICEATGWPHADTVKHVMKKLFPNVCRFSEEIETVQEKCQCYPKIWQI